MEEDRRHRARMKLAALAVSSSRVFPLRVLGKEEAEGLWRDAHAASDLLERFGDRKGGESEALLPLEAGHGLEGQGHLEGGEPEGLVPPSRGQDVGQEERLRLRVFGRGGLGLSEKEGEGDKAPPPP